LVPLAQFSPLKCKPFKEKKEIAGYLEKSKKGINLLTENTNKNQ